MVTEPKNRRGAAGWGAAGLLGLLTVALAGSADGQGFYRRGDATCSTSLAASDLVATLRALGGTSTCGNDDCDRDGALTPADVACAAGCLFGVCPVPDTAARVTAVMPDSAPAVVPSSVVRIAVANLGPADASKRVTIGGLEAEVIDERDGELVVALPPALPPGPAELVVIVGDVAGAPTLVEIEPPVPLGAPDTFDGALALVDETVAGLLTLDLESVYPDDAASVRDGLTRYRSDLAAQRVALAADPDLSEADRLALDAAIDASGGPEMLRAAIAEIAAAAGGTAEGGPAAAPAAVRALRNGARTIRVVGGVARTAAATTGIGAPILAIIGTELAINAGAILVASDPLTPLIFSVTYANAGGKGRAYPTAGGLITLKGAHFDAAFTVLEIHGRGFWTSLDGVNGADGSITYPLPNEVGTCGTVRFSLSHDGGRYRSNDVLSRFQPELLDLGQATGIPGQRITADVRGVHDCDADLTFTGVIADFSLLAFDPAPRVRAEVPPVLPGTYKVGLTVNGVDSPKDEVRLFSVGNPLTGLTIFCPSPLELGSLPTACVVTGVHGGMIPRATRLVWTSDRPGRVSVESSQSLIETRITARGLGVAKITAALESAVGPRQVLATSNEVAVDVVDRSAPEVSISSSATSPVQPGASIPVTVTLSDNHKLGLVQLFAGGDAVANGASQDSLVCLGKKTCSETFTVALKDRDFTQQTVSLRAEAVDASLNRGVSSTLTFTVGKDDTCPAVTIQQPASGGTVNAGETVSVVAVARDDGPSDSGVQRFRYSATGAALTAPVAVELPLSMPQKSPTLRFNFTVKTAAELADVEDKTIVISVEALDAATPPNTCGPQTAAVEVIGVLDRCQGGITTDKPAGYIGEAFTVTVALTGEGADEITRVTSINPGGQFDLTPQGGGVYTVTLFYQGLGGFTLRFVAFDADGMERCAGSIGLEALGPRPESGIAAGAAASVPAGAHR